MKTFEIIMVILTAIGLFGGIIVVWIKTQIDIATINVKITFFQKDLDRKEVAICNLENSNKHEHAVILEKIEVLIKEKQDK